MLDLVQHFLDLSERPKWRDLADGLACVLALIILAAAVALWGVAMGGHP